MPTLENKRRYMCGEGRIYDIACVVVVVCIPLPPPFCIMLFLMLVAIGEITNEKKKTAHR